MNLAVADMMQQHGWPAFSTFELGYQVMNALLDVRWDGAIT